MGQGLDRGVFVGFQDGVDVQSALQLVLLPIFAMKSKLKS
jgi:hypothetical protein